MCDFPIGIKNAFADGQENASFSESLYFLGVAVETVENPSLLGLVLFVEAQDIGCGPDIMDNQRLSVLFGKDDVTFEDFALEVIGIRMGTVEARFTDGSELILFKERL